MKQTPSQKFRLGMFVVLGTLVLMSTIYLIGHRQNMFGQTIELNAVFNNVNGLQKGNNVRYSGIQIGTVRNIEMINDTTILVNMVIEKKIIPHIKRDAIATISSDGLVGSMIINVIPGKGHSAQIAHQDTIQSYSRIRTEDILNTLNVTNENAALLTADLLKITKEINQGKGSIGILLRDTVMASDMKETLRYLKLTGKSTAESMKKVDQLISSLNNKDNVIGVIKDTAVASSLRKIAANLQKSSRQIDELTSNLNQTVLNAKNGNGAINYLSNNTDLVKRIDSIITNANESSILLKKDLEALQHNFLLRGYFRKQAKNKQKSEKQ